VDYKGKEFEGGKFWTGQGRLASKEKWSAKYLWEDNTEHRITESVWKRKQDVWETFFHQITTDEV
jgi:hypothetical protein